MRELVAAGQVSRRPHGRSRLDEETSSQKVRRRWRPCTKRCDLPAKAAALRMRRPCCPSGRSPLGESIGTALAAAQLVFKESPLDGVEEQGYRRLVKSELTIFTQQQGGVLPVSK